jgi:hypothetical protein
MTCPSLQECRGEGKEFVINVGPSAPRGAERFSDLLVPYNS